MNNYFQLLGVPPIIHIDLDELTLLYKKAAAESHPDQGGDEQHFNLLNTAYQTLKSPSKRLKHLLDVHSISYDKRGTVSNHLMNFFMSTGSTLQHADAFIKKKQATSSALSKALLEGESLEIQEQISEEIDALEKAHSEIMAGLSDEIEVTSYAIASRDLAFLEKWQAQLKERYASLF